MIIMFTGDNLFAIQSALSEHKASFLSQYDDYGLEIIDASDVEFSSVKDSLTQLPFLTPKRLIIIKGLQESKLVTEIDQDFLVKIPEENDVIFVSPKVDRRSRLFKLLDDSKRVKYFPKLNQADLIRWAIDYASKHGSSISRDNAQFLINRIGDDQLKLSTEIDKLSVMGEITTSLIDNLTDQSLDASIFQLLEQIFKRDQKKSLNTYDELISIGTEPLEIMSMIAWQLHVLARVKYSVETNQANVATKTGLHPFVVGKALKITKFMSVSVLKRAIDYAIEAEYRIKTISTSPVAEVRLLVLELSALD